MITDRELARYISSNLHLYLADEDKPVECKVVDVSKNNGGTVAGVQILMHGVDHGPVISMETIRGLLDIGMPREEVMKNIAELVHKEENIILLNKFDPEDYQRKMEYDFNKFCRESCEEILSKDESVKWRKSEIIYSDLDHSLVRFDGKDDEKDVHIYFRVFHSENDDRYEAVPVVLKDDKLIEAKSVEDAILRRDD